MGNKKDGSSIDPCEAYGWKVTEEELENNFFLVGEASYMACEFAQNSTSPILFNLAEGSLQRLQQQGMFPFPLPEKGFTIGQAGRVLEAEYLIEKALKELLVAAQPGVIWRGIDDVSKTDLDGFHKKFTQIISAFRGGEENFLCHSAGKSGPCTRKKKETIVEKPPPTGEGTLDSVVDNNLRLAYEAIVWTNFVATYAGVFHKIIYEGSLRVAKDYLRRLKNESKDPGLFPNRGYTLAQAKMRLDLANYAKAAYKAFHDAFDDASFPIDSGISRKKSLNVLYREFNPEGDDEPQPNIKSFLGLDFFHRKNPTETPTENQDFWVTSDGRKIRRKDAPWLRKSNHKS